MTRLQRTRLLVLFAALGLLCAAAVRPAAGQENQARPRRVAPPADAAPAPKPAQGGDTIELRSDLVTLTVSVVDAKGRPIGGLTPDSFRLFEDGRAQHIEYFEPVGDPYSLMLVLDTSGSTGDQVAKMRSAAQEFVDGLGADDRLGIITFSRGIEMLGELTNDRAELARHIADVQPTKARNPRGGRFDENTGTSFYDALYLACAESPLAEVKGKSRKAVVIFSDCVDSTSSYVFSQITDVVERSGASVYVLLFDTRAVSDQLLTQPPDYADHITFSKSQLDRFYDAYGPDNPDRDRDPISYTNLERLEINRALYDLAREQATLLATRTGGRVYPVKSITDLGGAYREIAAELRTRYSIGYYPTNERHDGSWRKLRVELPGHAGAQVVTRPGYWAPKE
jgi:Ca-activated chloride channel family protein